MQQTHTLDAYSDVDGPFELTIALDPDIGALAACLPPSGANVEDAIEVCLSVRSLASRRRAQEAAGRAESGSLTLQLDPEQYQGRVDVYLIARLREALPTTPGFAHLKSSTIATQLVTSVWFDEPQTFSGDSLDIIWRDFDEDPHLEDGHLFAIGLNERPVIYLNEAKSVSPLRSVLENKGTHGPFARTRDAVFQQIIHQAWTSILGHCFLEILRQGDDPVDAILESLDGWMLTVTRDWALTLVPEENDVDAAMAAVVDRVRESGNDFLLIEVPAAIQRRFNTMKSFHGLVREFNKEV